MIKVLEYLEKYESYLKIVKAIYSEYEEKVGAIFLKSWMIQECTVIPLVVDTMLKVLAIAIRIWEIHRTQQQ